VAFLVFLRGSCASGATRCNRIPPLHAKFLRSTLRSPYFAELSTGQMAPATARHARLLSPRSSLTNFSPTFGALRATHLDCLVMIRTAHVRGESLSHRIARDLESLNPHIYPWELEILSPCDQIRRSGPVNHAGLPSSLPENSNE